MDKLRLQGFNNLTKSLSVNIHDVGYVRTSQQKRDYVAHLDELFNADRLATILGDVAEMIGASVLNVARQDYEPEGASVTMLIAEAAIGLPSAKDSVVAHLDKSHITVHTYPEIHPDDGISTFRADIDVSTCGLISPLKSLDFLLGSFESDVVTLDYRVRGFTRDVDGRKHFIDHPISSIQDYMDGDLKRRYRMVDVNMPAERTFHTKMRLCELELERHLFGDSPACLGAGETEVVLARLEHEMDEIFYGRCLTGCGD